MFPQNLNIAYVNAQKYFVKGVPALYLTGPTGLTGPMGPTGFPGPDGHDPEHSGAIGPTGITGFIGLTGPTGSQGPRGETGETGPTGKDGWSGPTGSMGYIGPTSLITGPTATKPAYHGFTGFTGHTGPASLVTGPTGPHDHLRGFTGPTGHTGATNNIAGVSGPTGPTGEGGGHADELWKSAGSSIYASMGGNMGIFCTGPTGPTTGYSTAGTSITGMGKWLDISGNLRVRAVADVNGCMLYPVKAAQGCTGALIINTGPSGPLMEEGMLWVNKSATGATGWFPNDPGPPTWYPFDLMKASSFFGTAVLNGAGYIMGGFETDASQGGGSPDNIPPTLEPTNNMYIYEPRRADRSSADNGKWKEGPPMPMGTGRSQLGAAALGGKIYAVGGTQNKWNDIASASTEVVGTTYVHVYDPQTNKWSSVKPLPQARYGHGVAALGGKLYVAGGVLTADLTTAVITSTVLVYDPQTDEWSLDSHLPWSRTNLGIASVGGSLYAMGGSAVMWQPIDEGQAVPAANAAAVYNPAVPSDTTWTPIDDLPAQPPGPRSLFGMTTLDGRLYVISGYTTPDTAYPAGMTANCLVYDTLLKKWRDDIVPPARYFINGVPVDSGAIALGAITLGGTLYTIGGCNSTSVGTMNYSFMGSYNLSYNQTLRFTQQGEDFYISNQRGGPKTFIIPHPEYEGKILRHACIEAPTRGTNVYEYQIVTTEDDKTTRIELPSYFKYINGRPRIYVSPKDVYSHAFGIISNDFSSVDIYTEKAGTFNIMVTGIRKDPAAVSYSTEEYIDQPIALEDIPE